MNGLLYLLMTSLVFKHAQSTVFYDDFQTQWWLTSQIYYHEGAPVPVNVLGLNRRRRGIYGNESDASATARNFFAAKGGKLFFDSCIADIFMTISVPFVVPLFTRTKHDDKEEELYDKIKNKERHQRSLQTLEDAENQSLSLNAGSLRNNLRTDFKIIKSLNNSLNTDNKTDYEFVETEKFDNSEEYLFLQQREVTLHGLNHSISRGDAIETKLDLEENYKNKTRVRLSNKNTNISNTETKEKIYQDKELFMSNQTDSSWKSEANTKKHCPLSENGTCRSKRVKRTVFYDDHVVSYYLTPYFYINDVFYDVFASYLDIFFPLGLSSRSGARSLDLVYDDVRVDVFITVDCPYIVPILRRTKYEEYLQNEDYQDGQFEV